MAKILKKFELFPGVKRKSAKATPKNKRMINPQSSFPRLFICFLISVFRNNSRKIQAFAMAKTFEVTELCKKIFLLLSRGWS